ncbi:adhesion G protein-coupled receptor A3 [Chelonus insularis]|uniref:adhesion G protein-coupled receptor A3 n=1 Tax=Chelonus insularis TaxID=460826 RepID=UPI001588EA56|nr:adhesion G protein-coupled receptor A3 [Chelonus insularis]
MREVLLLCFLIEALKLVLGFSCPPVCTCRRVGPQAERLKVKCNKDLKEIDLNSIGVELYHLDLSKSNIHTIEPGTFKNLTNLRRLDLSNNKITALNEGNFIGLENLERLDLSKNEISSIDSVAFRPLANLKKLDLSANKLSTLDTSLFHDLLALERLKLSGNALKSLSEGTFHGLKLLRQLDLTNNPWKCDCYLYWLSNWKNDSIFKLNPAPICDSPEMFHGKSILDMKLSNEFQCQWTSPIIDIYPDQNQVVFAGDSISLKCRAPSITDDRSAKLNWLWNPSLIDDSPKLFVDPQETLSNIKVDNRYLSDSGIVDSSLSIFPVKQEHNGQWNCLLYSIHGNKTKSISIIVISEDTRYCPLAVTRNNKGMYAWPRTVVGWKVELPCEGIISSGISSTLSKASYQCDLSGSWTDLNTDFCPFISSITRTLEQFSNLNLTLTKENLLETIKRFKNFTEDSKKITDEIELNFITKTIENYVNFIEEEKELSAILVGIISSLMNLPKILLKKSELNYNVCSRWIKSLELITKSTPAIQIHLNNLALEEFHITKESFVGLSCTWYSSLIDDLNAKFLHCATSNRTAILNIKDKSIEASIRLPSSLLSASDHSSTCSLMISMFSHGILFPRIPENYSEVTSAVIGIKVIGTTVNLTEPVMVMLKVSHYHMATPPVPMIWEEKMNESGRWTPDGCRLTNLINNIVVFHCDRLGYYGLLEDTSYLMKMNTTGAKFRYSNPAIYVGTFMIITCLTCMSVTYIICYTSIIMPKRAKHSVINTWIAITLLCFLYTVGIQQTENIEICQGVGLVLHYLSLCCLLWMAVSASNMYKRLSKSDITVIPDDEIPEQPIQKPLLGLYLVGWGIALIVCGISGAINLREYAGYSYCFLTSGPALAALFIPAIILIIYLTIFYLLVRCTIRNVNHNGQLSEGTQATENVDLELLEPHENRADQNSINSTQTVSSEVEDIEHSQITQLKGHIIILILYLIMWSSGAIATAQPFSPHIPYDEMIFSILYAISSSTLGLFVLLFYGIARSDVRSQWTRMRCWLRKKKNRCCRTRSVSDANPSIPAQPLVQNITPVITQSQAIQAISDSNSISSSRHTSHSTNGKGSKAIEFIKEPSVVPNKKANVNLVVLHRQQYRSNNSVTTYTEASPAVCVEMFYNPHQSGVARKFFKKQRRNIKHNNLGPRKQGDGGATSDNGSCISLPRPAVKLSNDIDNINTSIFGSSVKVNNTNIHVELNPVNDVKNVNILSDSGGSVSEDRNTSVRYVIGSENIMRSVKKVNSDPISELTTRKETLSTLSPNESDVDTRTEEIKFCRNVSQQCSLEYSSEVETTTQMTSERSDQNLPDIGETPEKLKENDLRCNSLTEITQESNNSEFPPLSLRNSYRSSFNDITSLGNSSKNERVESRASLDDLTTSERSYKDDSRQRKNSERLSDDNFSEDNCIQDFPFFSRSLSNINRDESNFRLLDGLALPNLGEQEDLISTPNFLNKEFNSLTDLTTIDVTLGATRHLDMNASIGVDYEDTNYNNSEQFNDDTALDVEMLLETNSIKKETSV